MVPNQNEYFEKLVSIRETLKEAGTEYWQLYSDFSTWQFWVVCFILFAPLVILLFTIDRKNIFQIGFFGFAVHVLFAYIDSFGIQYGLWGYPYQVFPFLPSLSLDASIIPISIMLVYQWTLKHDKNFFIYAIITAAIFGFGFKPFLVLIGLFEKYKWVNYLIIFFIYIVLFLLGYLLTRLFQRMQKKSLDTK
ncbi:hypothetical protein KO561_03690 [Radiobacillus kanasensis]|uniref:CBO0543 family protein n=1 Tax=Radiobacillus kanasensis TaxID=2844358 RepID=UPI001E435568|nr:CBO0543 family protein [Radiobacillus kanasensis]UFU00078.1 hypothetical protein KO561_03690 [Radiobacillus kanasensis]